MFFTLSRCAFAFLALSTFSVMESCTTPVQFLHPLSDSTTRAFAAELAGNWEKAGDDGQAEEVWTFKPDKDNSGYTLEIRQSGEEPGTEKANKPPLILRVELVKLGAHTFIDYRLKDGDCGDSAALLLPVHLLGEITVQNSELRVTFVESDWLTKERMQQGGWAFEVVDNDQLLVTARTEALQQLVSQWATEGAPKNETILRRK